MVRKHSYAPRPRAQGPRSAWPLGCSIRAEGGVTRIDVYDDIGADGYGGGLTSKDFAQRLAGLKGPLQVNINSAGGDVFQGIAIGNALRDHKGRVKTVVDGVAASIASVIVQAGDEREMAPGSMLMAHDAFGFCVGDASEMSRTAQALDKVSNVLAGVYAERSGRGTPASWREVMRAETWYTDREAVTAGLADRVGAGTAVAPAGLDLAAFTGVPGRIAAQLRTLPRPPGSHRAATRGGTEPTPEMLEQLRAALRAVDATIRREMGPARTVRDALPPAMRPLYDQLGDGTVG
jgi:ATP-dependent protease ClpP protease subunit